MPNAKESRWRLCLVLAVTWLTLSVPFSEARPEYPDRIPNGRNVKDQNGNIWAGVGHLRSAGSGALNPFGEDFLDAGLQWTTALCQKDSDGDGATNGQELGDPNCVWTPGDEPQGPPTGHPGFGGDVPAGAIDTCKSFSAPAHSVNLTMQFNPGFTLPAGVVTTYPRQAFNLTTLAGSGGNVDHWMLRFEVIYGGPIDVVHHILVYSCTANEIQGYLAAPKTTGGMPCSGGLVYGWAIDLNNIQVDFVSCFDGTSPVSKLTHNVAYCMPNGVALRFNKNAPFVLMEVHMNNAAKAAGIVSTPGLKITALPLNQPQPPTPFKQANWLWLGADLNSINLPPGKPYVELTATKDVEASPAFSLELFASLSHLHYIGRKAWVERIPASGRSVSLACNPRYDNEDQELIPISEPVIVTNNDRIVVHCVFDTSNRTTVTRGGEETEDEMCFVFFLYLSDQISVPITKFEDAVMTFTPQETSVSCQGAVIDEDGLISPSLPPWLVAHVVLGAIGFGFLMPLGSLFPASKAMRALPHAAWFKSHKALVGVGCLAGWISFAIGIGSVTSRLLTTHGQLGLSITLLAIVQTLLGVFRPHLPSQGSVKSQARAIWEYAHPFLGRTIIVCCAAQMYLGYDRLLNLYLSSSALEAWAWVHSVGIFVLWFITLVIFKTTTGTTNGSSVESAKQSPHTNPGDVA